MSTQRLRIGILAGLCLIGNEVCAQSGEKISVPPVPEQEKEKYGVVDSSYAISQEDLAPAVVVDEQYAGLHDSSNIEPRAIPEAALERFRNDPNYEYDRVETGGPSVWELFWRWVDDALFRPLRENTSREFWTWFWILAGLLAVAFVISKALQADGGWFLRKRDADLAPDGLVLLDTEDIKAIDLDALLVAALKESRYRDAARFQYLRALQELTEQDVIHWDKYKTNREYLAEVRGANRPALNAPFADITRLFEWIWYGEFPLDERRFALVRARFALFSHALEEIQQ